VSDFCVTYLDSIDKRLLEYLDEDDELKLDAIQRLRFYTSALLEGSITPEHTEEAGLLCARPRLRGHLRHYVCSPRVRGSASTVASHLMSSFGTWLVTGDVFSTVEPFDRQSSTYGPIATWVTASSSCFNGLGVVIVPPVGYEHSSSFRALHVLAQELAERGCLVARVDPFGTGDSAGIARDVTSFRAWQNAVQEGAAYVRKAGAREVLLLGCRIGATLALLAAPSVEAIAVAALAPVLSGRRYVRELRMMSLHHEEAGLGMIVAGTEFPRSLLADISEVDLVRNYPGGVPCLLVARTTSDDLESAFAEGQTASGTMAEVWVSSALGRFLDRAAEEAVIDATFTTELTEWICGWAPGVPDVDGASAALGDLSPVPSGPDCDATSLTWAGRRVSEKFVTVGHDRLVGLLTTPQDVISPAGNLVVFLNSGSDPHTGPGRAWVEMARGLATCQVSALRVDMRGWGDSPDGPRGRYAPGRPYDPHSLDDVRAILAWLCQQGWDRVVLAGLCVGAWLALEVARDTKFGGVLALNAPMLYQPGDPIIVNSEAWRVSHQAEIAEIKREAATGRWDREDRAGMRPPAGLWLDSLVENGIPISLIYSSDDYGLEYLTDRLPVRLAAAQESGSVRVHVIPDIDHSMFRTWLRPKVLEIFVDELNCGIG